MCNNDHYYGCFIDSEARRVMIIISITNTNSLSYYSYFETTGRAMIPVSTSRHVHAHCYLSRVGLTFGDKIVCFDS